MLATTDLLMSYVTSTSLTMNLAIYVLTTALASYATVAGSTFTGVITQKE